MYLTSTTTGVINSQSKTSNINGSSYLNAGFGAIIIIIMIAVSLMMFTDAKAETTVPHRVFLPMIMNN